MNPILSSLGLVLLLAAPAAAQIADPDIDALLRRYVERFNKGEAEALAREVYVGADQTALEKMFDELRADSFGRMEVYDVSACPVVDGKTKVGMIFARIYTFGGKMNDDEAKVFDLARTPDGWRITGEDDVAVGEQEVC